MLGVGEGKIVLPCINSINSKCAVSYFRVFPYSVERLFHQMKDGPGRTALYPLVVTSEGILIFPDEVYKWPNVIGAMFHNHV